MPQRDRTPFQKPFQKTWLAVSVAALCTSLGACSTVPRDDGDGMLERTGEATRVAGSRLWDRTRHLLGFTGDADTGRPGRAGSDGRELDEVDLAMMKEDAVMPGAADVVRSDEWSDIAAAGEAANESVVDEALFDAEANASGDGADVPALGLTHEVGAGETLWDVAKMTTGDATNWHVLADVNDLAPDAAVYPGQTLTIPADMVRPELAGLASTAERPASGEALAADAAPAGRLAVPTAAADAGERLAAEVSDLVDGGDALAESMADAEAGTLPDGGAAGATGVELDAGETLWDFAKRTTGDATNWRAIAEANGFSEERATKVREGESIAVPSALLKDELVTADAAAVPAAPEAATLEGAATEAVDAAAATGERDALVPIADAADALGDEVVDGASELAAGLAAGPDATDGADAGEPVRIVEAAYRAEPASVVAEQPAATSLPDEIMVSGTYYPKAVYNDADFSSSLLMRVSPGTTLQVSRAVGPWYEVSTDQGTGYVHARDIK